MELGGMSGWLYRISEVISRMAYVNILWILFTILGLGLFGFMPATVALFAVIRKWIMGEKEIPIFSTFWNNYRKEFIKSNLLGAILLIIGYILYIDLTFVPTGGFFTALRIGLLVITLFFVIILLYIFPLYAHFEWKIRLYLKNSLLLGLSHPHYTLMMIVGIVALYYICLKFPGIIPFFSISILAYILMWPAYLVIKKIEDLQASDEEENVENASVQNK